MAGRLLINNAGFLDQGDIGRGAAIAYGRLVGIHFDQGVVHSETGQRRENMFNGLDLCISLDDRCSPLDCLYVLYKGIDNRFIWEIGAAELVTVTNRGWVEGESDVAAIVQSASS